MQVYLLPLEAKQRCRVDLSAVRFFFQQSNRAEVCGCEIKTLFLIYPPKKC